MQGSRADKVGEQIKMEVSMIVEKEIKDPRIGFVTIIYVEIKDDLRFARIYFSKMGTVEEKQKALEGLESASGFIRKLIGERIPLRYVPEIVFKLDESAEYSQHIEDILKQIKEKSENKNVDKQGN